MEFRIADTFTDSLTLVRKGSVPCQKVGKHWRFHKYAIDRWLQQQRKDANKKGARDR